MSELRLKDYHNMIKLPDRQSVVCNLFGRETTTDMNFHSTFAGRFLAGIAISIYLKDGCLSEIII